MSDLPLRPELVGMTAYGAPQLPVEIRLNTNENPFPPPPALVADIAQSVAKAAEQANRYPDRDCVELRGALAGYVVATTGAPVSGEQVWAANGSNEILQQILQAFGGPGRTALGFTPTYSMHDLISRGTNTRWVPVPRADGLSLTSAEVVAAIREHTPDVLLLCSPNNPTGESVTPDIVEAAYAEMTRGDRGMLVVDEAYAEFATVPSAVHSLTGRPRMIVCRTMSKAFAFAGARIGYLVADPAVIDALQLVRLPYHLSAFTQAAGLAALRHRGELAEQVRALRATRDEFVATIAGRGWVTSPSDANFVLVGRFRDAQRAWRTLVEAGILVRDVNLPGWLRVTIGTPEQMSALVAALDTMTDLREAP